MYNILFHKKAAKFYTNANENIRKKINKAVESISLDPYYNIHIKKLQGKLSDMYRYRTGDIRILYEIHEGIKTVRIKTIEVRGNVY